MDVKAKINSSLVRSVGFPPILPVMFSSTRMLVLYSLYLSDDHCNFTYFDHFKQENLLVCFCRTNRL